MITTPDTAPDTTPFLETKLFAPIWRPGSISRPRLVQQLNQGRDRKLILLSAQAGFGKTTALAEWIGALRADGIGIGWVSLDSGDNDSQTFWSYVLAALNNATSGSGARALTLLHSSQQIPLDNVLARVINEFSSIRAPLFVMLDDFHLIESTEIHKAVAFLVEHLPPNLHIVITSRSDPPLPLPRLRARGDITELRAADLRFTIDEASAFLAGSVGPNLTEEEVSALETRTEGWIAGLRLAALSLQGRHDVSEMIRTFAGNDRFIVDYLIDEVMQGLPADVRSFLLETAVLDRLNSDLCDAMTGRADGREMLAYLDQANLFVVPLDNRRLWYRYHHLFAEVLQVQLLRDDADQIPALHKRAAEWFASNGSQDDAIRHALTAGDAARAAELIELAIPAIRASKQYTRALGWIGALPAEIIRNRPVLSAAYGSLLLGAGDFTGADLHLRNAEFWLGMTEGQRGTDPDWANGPVVTDAEEYQKLPVMIGVYRAAHSHFSGETGAAMAHARGALANAKEHQHFLIGAAAGLLGMALWTEGDVEAAIPQYRKGIENQQKLGNLPDVVSGAMYLGDMQMVQGRLRAAEMEYRQALDLATAQGEPLLLGTADLYVGLADIQRERNDLAAAAESLERSFALAETSGLPENQFRRSLAQSRLHFANGHFVAALASLDAADQFAMRGCYPAARPISVMRIPILIAMGDREAVEQWATGTAVGEDFGYLREFELMTLARGWVAIGDRDAAERSLVLVDRLLGAARTAHRNGSVLELLILQALVLQQIGERDAAMGSLTEAMVSAEPERYARIFLDEGPLMRDLLSKIPVHSRVAGFGEWLLSQPVPALDLPKSVIGQAGYVQLTAREIEILHLVAAGMRNQQIADHLFIGLATVKRHVANLYGKLGVSHRTEAILRARDLGLL